jgi:hypothetical protein
MKTRLDELEARLQALIEESTAVFPWINTRDRLAHRWIEAMQRSLVEEINGAVLAPESYVIYLHPEVIAALPPQNLWLEGLEHALREAAMETGVRFVNTPGLRLAANPQMAQDDVQVMAALPDAAPNRTAVWTTRAEPLHAEPGARPVNAYLIIDGTRIFPLGDAVINLGRRPENHLALDDPRVSRSHAQIRAIRGQYVLFDLNSTGGTYINGIRITQHYLQAGDVISLAGVNIIYAEEPLADEHSTGRLSAAVPPGSPELLE